MATQRVSRWHKRILRWLLADHQRTRGVTDSSHYELVKALGGEKGTISQSLHTLEARRWIVLGRTLGGWTESLSLTPAGLEKAAEICIKL
jgi:DNA-binding MarR family transcriptional regulator